MAVAEGSDKKPSSLSGLRSEGRLSANMLSKFDQPSIDSESRTDKPRPPRKVWSRPSADQMISPDTISSPLAGEPKPMKLPSSELLPAPQHSSTTTQVEPKTPSLSDNPFIRRDSSSDRRCQDSKNKDADCRGQEDTPRSSIADNPFLLKDKSARSSRASGSFCGDDQDEAGLSHKRTTDDEGPSSTGQQTDSTNKMPTSPVVVETTAEADKAACPSVCDQQDDEVTVQEPDETLQAPSVEAGNVQFALEPSNDATPETGAACSVPAPEVVNADAEKPTASVEHVTVEPASRPCCVIS